MKNQVLLIDDSLTVQKVVSLTLDKNKFSLTIAKTKAEALKILREKAMDVILVSDQVSDLVPSQFPKEVELWISGSRILEPMVLVTSQDLSEAKQYAAVLRKPFAPPALQSLVAELSQQKKKEIPTIISVGEKDEFVEENLHHKFQENFAPDSELVNETMRTFHSQASKESTPSLEMFFNEQTRSGNFDINQAIEKVLDKILPPIVEKLVKERLDSLLRE